MRCVGRILAATLWFALGSLGTAVAQTPVRVLVGFPPGGGTDGVARLFAAELGKVLSQPVIVENRPGAAGQIVAIAVKNAKPEDNVLMVVPGYVVTLTQQIVKTPAYDPLKDFVAVANVGSYDVGLAVADKLPPKTLKDWVTWVKSDSKNLTIAAGSAGSDLHLWALLLGQKIQVPLEHVPYRGLPQAITDLVGGQISSGLLPLANLLPTHNTQKIRILAQSGAKRSSEAANIPTFTEAGVPFEASGWYGLFAPAGTPPELVARYNKIIVDSMRKPEVLKQMKALGLNSSTMTPADVAAMAKTDHQLWSQIIKQSGLKLR